MYKVEVIADNSGKWASNGKLFETTDLAVEYAIDLWTRWTLVQKWRVINTSDDSVVKES